ncbi:hypothetical protein NDU88_003922 [Pleurodeles waltl]|uniref:Uncharacterized protein n=1 Tax=Pleurodeles waltl TaxID=8319 RepID=A0AAV7VJ78_PLEWA|nr:hypothetical protein NDU88_003922 [Pleurodeles waltl]
MTRVVLLLKDVDPRLRVVGTLDTPAQVGPAIRCPGGTLERNASQQRDANTNPEVDAQEEKEETCTARGGAEKREDDESDETRRTEGRNGEETEERGQPA